MNYNAVISVSFSGEGNEPVTLQEAKDWCKIDVPDDDDLIAALIKGARIICENYSGVSFVQKTVTAIIQNGLGNINLPYGPVTGSVAYTNPDGTAITGDYNISIPKCERIKAVYTGGYTTLPGNLKTAVLNQIAWMYENRGDAKVSSGVLYGGGNRVSSAISEMAKLILNQIRE